MQVYIHSDVSFENLQMLNKITVGCATCVYFDPTAGHSWIYREPTVGAIHGRGSEDAGERCVMTYVGVVILKP